ncbi:spermidine/putrescine ABC transporter substrate-binding protein [Photobacterium sp. SDRW27]|uniref:polyamine ABC transporter substrate-binding protein n=1 Tax=Photobacterium obscurum TaxID=2829490 RepID=UPI0022438480|nr:spermidine/putrescine ABC transporter substrate-binding protein [Photobacterium obscurum]MCW8327616.1 spermidine/putrescine ABC transporter substrate-binding protein [Photobacterium obscurum]
MRNYILVAGFSILAVLNTATADEITIYNWEAYLAEEVIDTFTEETGHTVYQVYFDDDTYRNSIITSGRGNQFDLVMIDAVSLDLFSQEKLLRPLSSLPLKNIDNNAERWRKSCGDYGFPYSWGTIGIAVRGSISDVPISSWKQFFSPPSEHRKRLVLHRAVEDLPAIALLANKQLPNSSEPQELKQAFRLMQQQQEYVLAYEYGMSYAIDHGPNSRMSMTMAYSADLEEIINQTGQKDWEYVVPQEGTMIWVDCFAMPLGREPKPATLAFLDFIARPDIAAKNAELTWISTPIPAAYQQLPAEIQNDTELYPPKEVMVRSHTFQTLTKSGFSLRRKMVSALKLD